MKKLIAALCLSLPLSLFSQNSIVQEGEFGFGLGAAHYFGDLNTRAKLNRPKLAAGLFFRKNFGNYIALRLAGNFAQLGYSDVYNTHNEAMKRRNLSFNTNVWELALQGDFNFYRFMPGDPDFSFTPYVTLGVSAFSFDPYAYLKDEKYNLRQLGTEGQGSTLYPDRKQYGTMALAIPLGVGLKYALNDRINLGFEVLYRFTNTDYLDDVSRTYADPAAFPPNPDGTPSVAFLLQDRSYETGTRIGGKDIQRGNSQNKDQFVTAMFTISLNLQSYKCPTAN
ncbi:outer membrane beta-barrel protein [Flavisolibacter sp. BT320]|nr:outer membrane beta-barrel protein [Flavisolibacter longurius]